MKPGAVWLHRKRRLVRIVLEVRSGQIRCLDVDPDGYRRETLVDAGRFRRFVAEAEERL